MTCYSVNPRDQIFLKDYGFLPFAENKSQNVAKNISKNLSSKYRNFLRQKLLDHSKQSTKDALKTPSKRES